jgi:hypothetical protein
VVSVGGGGLKATAVLHFHSFPETSKEVSMSSIMMNITRRITEAEVGVAPKTQEKKPRKTRSDKGKTNKKCCSCERTERQLEKGEDGKGTFALFFNAETKQTLITSYAQGFPELVCYECDMNSRENKCDDCEKYYYTKGIYSEADYQLSLKGGMGIDGDAPNSCSCEDEDCESLWDETDFDTGVECFNC